MFDDGGAAGADDFDDEPDEPDEPDPRDHPKGYARGYMRGLTIFRDLLIQHGFSDHQGIYDFCADLYERLLEWQSQDDDSDPPESPPYRGARRQR